MRAIASSLNYIGSHLRLNISNVKLMNECKHCSARFKGTLAQLILFPAFLLLYDLDFVALHQVYVPGVTSFSVFLHLNDLIICNMIALNRYQSPWAYLAMLIIA